MKKIILTIIFIISINTRAQTVVTDTFILNKTINWTKAGSPYILRTSLNLSSSTLNVVNAQVIFEGGSINFFNNSVLNISESDISGTGNFSYALSSFNSNIEIKNTNINIDRFIESYSSHVRIDGLKNSNTGNQKMINLYNNSDFSLINSRIENYKGNIINIDNANYVIINNTEFINNEKVITFHKAKSSLINNNDFENNHIAIESFMFDQDNTKIDLENNYFKKDYPYIYNYTNNADTEERDILAGPFSIKQFSKNKNIGKMNTCCSNIIFLPGLMGSRLYMDGFTQNQLWEPNRNADVKKLFLNNYGQSLNKVYTKDVIDKTNILGGLTGIDQDIYKGFLDYINNLKKNKIINDYVSEPYDWRMSIDYIIDNGIDLKNKKINLINAIQELQKTSKTGKVTIMTHSNGGLMAKQLMIELKKNNLNNIIDKIIFVAMPEYGTPQAITSLLYGHNQSIAGGLILKSSVAKDLAKNMSSAYTLLPSEKYYTYKNIDKNFIDNTVNNYKDLNVSLLNKSKDIHNILDNISYSDNVSVYQILGTGINTVSDIGIDNKNKIIPIYDKNGDGVVEDLFGFRFGTTTYIDLKDTKYSHVNIMNDKDVILNIDHIINPIKYLGSNNSNIGLDYNKIIKNNNYGLLQISQNDTFNKLSRYVTLPNIDISIGLSNINTIDNYYSYSNSDFNKSTESTDKNNRFEIMNDNIEYVYNKDIDNIKINSRIDDFLDLNIIKNIDGQISNTEFKNIPVFKDIQMMFKIDDSFNTLSLNLPMAGKIVTFQSLQNQNQAQSKLSMNEIIDSIISDIKASSMEKYLKDRYIRRVELYRKNKDLKYLNTLKNKVSDSINSINKISYSSALKARYSKLKEDYIYLNILLLRL